MGRRRPRDLRGIRRHLRLPRHGWSNLQSVHLNLPFHSDDEFRRLHAAIRVALPLLPALAASSPIQGRSPSGFLDARLEAYRHNCARVPLVTGHVIPELARSPAEYDERILQPMYRAIAPLDPGGVLQDEWLNARGAIARFDRNTIEIRVLDIQECPAQDLALLGFIDALLRALQCGALSPLDEQEALGERALEQIFLRAIRDGRFAPAIDAAWLSALGLDGKTKSLGDAAAALMHRLGARDAWWGDGVRFILRSGSLAERILGAMSQGEPLPAIYRRLAESLAGGIRFEASANA
ncbi:MAG: glutamate-cysteine ligase family protein [Verrucomicrobiales bacterium]